MIANFENKHSDYLTICKQIKSDKKQNSDDIQ